MDAREFAVWAHANQTYGDRPYVHHLEAVASLVAFLDDPEQVLVPVAYLHDVIEDTPVTANFLREIFGTSIAVAVEYLTDPEEGTRRERKAVLHDRMSRLKTDLTEHRAALIVKAADRCANLSQCIQDDNGKLLNMYKAEHKAFRKAVMRPHLCPEIWEQIDNMVAR